MLLNEFASAAWACRGTLQPQIEALAVECVPAAYCSSMRTHIVVVRGHIRQVEDTYVVVSYLQRSVCGLKLLELLVYEAFSY